MPAVDPKKQRTSELMRRAASEFKWLANLISVDVDVQELSSLADELNVRANLIELKRDRVSSQEEINLLNFIDIPQ